VPALVRIAIIPLLIVLLVGGCREEASQEPAYAGHTFREDAVFVSAHRFATHGLEWLGAATPELPSGKLQDAEITVLVHGYSTPHRRFSDYFDGLISYLRFDAGYVFPIVVLHWRSLATHHVELSAFERFAIGQAHTRGDRPHFVGPSWEQGQYVADQHRARTVGADGLVALLQEIRQANAGARVNIVAHSMGTLVVHEALRRATPAFASVRRFVLLAPDLSYAAFQDGRIAFRDDQRVQVFFSRHDGILFKSALVNYVARLGRSGPKNPSQLPPVFTVHDATQLLGAGDTHGRYVTQSGARKLKLMAALSGE
jgi:pimeloyl-ACP methyl ester carboxylesterase